MAEERKDSLHGSSGPLTTKQLNERLDQLERTQRTERHDANGKIGAAILKQGEEQIRAADRLTQLETTVHNMNENIREMQESLSPFTELAQGLKNRIMGDPDMKSEGLISEHNELKDRLGTIEQIAKDTKREQRIAVAVLLAIGGVVTWFQQTGALGFFAHKP